MPRLMILCLMLVSIQNTISAADDDQPYVEMLYPVETRVLDYVTRSGDEFVVSTRIATADDFETVVAFYAEKLGRELKPQQNRVGAGGERGPRVSVVTDDSYAVRASGPFLNFDNDTSRGLKLLTFSRVTQDEQITLVISRLDGEEYTHIVLTHVKHVPGARN